MTASPPQGGRGMEIIMTITTADAATALATTPRELRKFLRSDASKIESVGKGARYALKGDAKSITALRKRFDAWRATQTPDAPDA